MPNGVSNLSDMGVDQFRHTAREYEILYLHKFFTHIMNNTWFYTSVLNQLCLTQMFCLSMAPYMAHFVSRGHIICIAYFAAPVVY